MGRRAMPTGTYGTIWTSDAGQPYKARARFRRLDGSYVEVVRYGQTKTAARDGVREALRDLQDSVGDTDLNRTTLMSAVADRWLAEGIASGDWSIGTQQTYRDMLEKHVKPRFGQLRVGEVRVQVIDAGLRGIIDQAGPGSAKTAKSVLSGVCSYAIRQGAMESNPVRDTMRIPRPRKTVRALTTTQADQIVDGLRASQRATEFDLPDLVEFMLATGCRIGEACAARESVLELDGEARTGTWEVNATVIRSKGVGLVIQQRPKTAAGWRVLALPPFAVDMLIGRRDKAQFGGPEGVVFGSPWAHALRDKSNTTGELRKELDALGFDWVTSHVFRKTVATRMDEAGCTARQIADQLGHAKPSMTQDVYMGRAVVSSAAATVLDR